MEVPNTRRPQVQTYIEKNALLPFLLVTQIPTEPLSNHSTILRHPSLTLFHCKIHSALLVLNFPGYFIEDNDLMLHLSFATPSLGAIIHPPLHLKRWVS